MLANECCCGQRLESKLTGRVTLQHSEVENVMSCAQLAFGHKSGSKGKVKDKPIGINKTLPYIITFLFTHCNENTI